MQLRCGAWCDRIGALPQSVKHIVVNTTVPVVFPKLPLSETTFTAVDSVPFLKGALQKTGIGAGIVDKCASPLTVHLVADLSPPYFCKLAGGLKSIKCYFAFLRVCAKRYDRVFLPSLPRLLCLTLHLTVKRSFSRLVQHAQLQYC